MRDLKTAPPYPADKNSGDVVEHEGQRFVVCSYPSMGGYGGTCLVNVDDAEGCFEAFVWHDGEFPFTAVDYDGVPNSPAHLHHCSAQQFIDFGKQVLALQASVVPGHRFEEEKPPAPQVSRYEPESEE